MSLIKHKSVSSIRPLCDKVRIQSWRYHLVNLGDFNTHSFMHTQLPALHLLRPGLTEKEVGEVVWSGRTVTSEEEMGTLCGLAGLSPQKRKWGRCAVWQESPLSPVMCPGCPLVALPGSAGFLSQPTYLATSSLREPGPQVHPSVSIWPAVYSSLTPPPHNAENRNWPGDPPPT